MRQARLERVAALAPRFFREVLGFEYEEVAAMRPVIVSQTSDRSVLGVLVDFGKLVPHCLVHHDSEESPFEFVESQLATTPCLASRPFDEVIFPERESVEKLEARWGSG